MKTVLCFGEIMLRLNPEGYLRIKQADRFLVSFAGGEANVAVSLANYGIHARFVTKLPENDISELAIKNLRAYAVDTSDIVRGGERLGLYYVEKGASQRPSKVIYDRKYSAFAAATPQDFEWDKLFCGVDVFHITGITPALSDSMAKICVEAVKKAKEKNITVSFDLNYRKNLWTPEKARSVAEEIMPYVDICIGNEEDAKNMLGIETSGTDVLRGQLCRQDYIETAQKIQELYGCHTVAITLRKSISASDNGWAAMIYKEGKACFSKEYLIHIVDRVGGGDSFCGALLYGYLSNFDPQKAIDFAVAASCLKHTTEYDFNLATEEEVFRLLEGDGSGRVQR